jgi:hypothetical protein
MADIRTLEEYEDLFDSSLAGLQILARKVYDNPESLESARSLISTIQEAYKDFLEDYRGGYVVDPTKDGKYYSLPTTFYRDMLGEILVETLSNSPQLEDVAAQAARDFSRIFAPTDTEDKRVSSIMSDESLGLSQIIPPAPRPDTPDYIEALEEWSSKAKAAYGLALKLNQGDSGQKAQLLNSRDAFFDMVDDYATTQERLYRAPMATDGINRVLGSAAKYTVGMAGAAIEKGLEAIDWITDITPTISGETIFSKAADVVSEGTEGIQSFLDRYIFPTDPRKDENFLSLAAEAVGQAVPLIGAGLVGSPAALTTILGGGAAMTFKEREEAALKATGSAGVASANQGSSAMVEAGIDILADAIILKTGKVLKLAAKAPKSEKLDSLMEIFSGELSRKAAIAQRAAIGAVTEGTTEAVQGAIAESALAKASGMPEFSAYNMSNRARDFLAGAIGGGFAGGVLGAFQAPDTVPPINRREDEPTPAPPPVEQPMRGTMPTQTSASPETIIPAEEIIAETDSVLAEMPAPEAPTINSLFQEKIADIRESIPVEAIEMGEIVADILGDPDVTPEEQQAQEVEVEPQPIPEPREPGELYNQAVNYIIKNRKISRDALLFDLAMTPEEVNVTLEALRKDKIIPPDYEVLGSDIPIQEITQAAVEPVALLPEAVVPLAKETLKKKGVEKTERAQAAYDTVKKRLNFQDNDPQDIYDYIKSKEFESDLKTVGLDSKILKSKVAALRKFNFVSKPSQLPRFFDALVGSGNISEAGVMSGGRLTTGEEYEGLGRKGKDKVSGVKVRAGLFPLMDNAIANPAPKLKLEDIQPETQFGKKIIEQLNNLRKNKKGELFKSALRYFDESFDADIRSNFPTLKLEPRVAIDTKAGGRTANVTYVLWEPETKVEREALGLKEEILSTNWDSFKSDSDKTRYLSRLTDKYYSLVEALSSSPEMGLMDIYLSTPSQVQENFEASTRNETLSLSEYVEGGFRTGKLRTNPFIFSTQTPVPDNRDATVANLIMNEVGIKIVSDPTSGKDPKITANAGLKKVIDPKTNTESYESWTTRYTAASGKQQSLSRWHELGEWIVDGKQGGFRLTDELRTALLENSGRLRKRIGNLEALDTEDLIADMLTTYFVDPNQIKSNPVLAKYLGGLKTTSGELRTRLRKVEAITRAVDADPTLVGRTNMARSREAILKADVAIATRNVPKKPQKLLEQIRDSILENAPIERIINNFNNVKGVNQRMIDSVKAALLHRQLNRGTFQYFARELFPLQAKLSKEAGISQEEASRYMFLNRIAEERGQLELAVLNEDGSLNQSGLMEELFDTIRSYLEMEGLSNLMTDWVNNRSWLNANPKDGRVFVKEYWEQLSDIALSPEGLAGDVLQSMRRAAFENGFAEANLLNMELAPRGRIQNPGDYNAETARAELERFKEELGSDKVAAMKDLQSTIARLYRAAIEGLYRTGAISKRTRDSFIANSENYATFVNADILADDPQITASIYAASGMVTDSADLLTATFLKLAAMQSRIVRQTLSNKLSDLFIKAGVAREYNMENENPSLGATIQKLKELREIEDKKARDGGAEVKSYLLASKDGEYKIIEIDVPFLETSIFNPSDAPDVISDIAAASSVARKMYTSWSLGFAVGSRVRAAKNYYIQKGKGAKLFAPKLSWLTQPLWLYHTDPEIREFHRVSKEWAKRVLAADPIQRMESILTPFPEDVTLDDIMKAGPDAPLRLMGAIMPAESRGVASRVPTGLLEVLNADKPTRDAMARAYGRPLVEGPVSKLIDKTLSAPMVQRLMNNDVASILFGLPMRGIRTAARKIEYLNDLQEITEKFVGLISAMNNGESFTQAQKTADLFYGNPMPGNRSAVSQLGNPWMIFLNSHINGLIAIEDLATSGDSRVGKMAAMLATNAVITTPVVAASIGYALTKMMGGSDEEADDRAEVFRKLVENIPLKARLLGTALPLAFIRPDGSWVNPFFVRAGEIQDDWKTLHLYTPGDFNSQYAAGLIEPIFSEDIGFDMAASAVSNIMDSVIPAAGPVLGVGRATADLLMGINPVDTFTKRPIFSDQVYAAGGSNLVSAYLQYALSEFSGNLFEYEKEDDQIADNSGLNLLNSVVRPVLRATNYGAMRELYSVIDDTEALKARFRLSLGDNAMWALQELKRTERLLANYRLELVTEKAKKGESMKGIRIDPVEVLGEADAAKLKTLRGWKRGIFDVGVEENYVSTMEGADVTNEILESLEESASKLREDLS